MHLFTYGTLMFPEVWRIVVGRKFAHIRAELLGYQVFRVRDAVYPGIIEVSPQPSIHNSQSSTVPGLVYLDLDAASFERLDRFEGDQYRRRSVAVTCPDGRQLAAQSYVVRSALRETLTEEIWTVEKFEAGGHLAEFIARYRGFERLG